MGTKADRPEGHSRKLLSIGWAAGIGITLVEMQFGMEYVLSHVAAEVGFAMSWLPTISVLARHLWR